jgi:hypothetical protein
VVLCVCVCGLRLRLSALRGVVDGVEDRNGAVYDEMGTREQREIAISMHIWNSKGIY